MSKLTVFRIITVLLLSNSILISCNFPDSTSNPITSPSATEGFSKTKEPDRVSEAFETGTPTITITSTATQFTPSNTPTSSPTPTWVFHEPGPVVAPILLYHHVSADISTSRYQVSIPEFRAQMNALHDMGYTTIPISTLLDAIIHGAPLPEKPVVITFDDGHISVYENAFPIMNEFGFKGVFYIVANRINNLSNFVNIAQITEMQDAGWEIGSHSYTHADLTQSQSIAAYEIAQSKTDLEFALSSKIQTFAYPYGAINPFVAQKVHDYGYRAGMGLGTSMVHSVNSLYYLQRIEIYGNYSNDYFRDRLQQE